MYGASRPVPQPTSTTRLPAPTSSQNRSKTTRSRGTQYKSLHELSKGQKATALLLMLLIDATAPLFIDQPEDNLDNRFVFDEIVPRLRQLKGQRQLVLSTHNANVPVLGDADLVVAMECVDNTGCVADGGVGSLDDEGVRRLTGILLEGGQAAFAARQHLYGY